MYEIFFFIVDIKELYIFGGFLLFLLRHFSISVISLYLCDRLSSNYDDMCDSYLLYCVMWFHGDFSSSFALIPLKDFVRSFNLGNLKKNLIWNSNLRRF